MANPRFSAKSIKKGKGMALSAKGIAIISKSYCRSLELRDSPRLQAIQKPEAWETNRGVVSRMSRHQLISILSRYLDTYSHDAFMGRTDRSGVC